MAAFTQPPYFLFTSRRYLLRMQIPIFRGMPAQCQFWMGCPQIVKSHKYFSSGTIRAPLILIDSITDSGFPFMPASTEPPHFFVAAWRYHVRPQVTVAVIVPFCGDVGAQRLEIVKARQRFLIRAVWAVGTFWLCSAIDCGLPSMMLLALPPYFFSGT